MQFHVTYVGCTAGFGLRPVESSTQGKTLRLEGHLGGPWLNKLRRSCARVFSEGRRLSLDLAGVSFIDGEGVGLSEV